MLQNLHDYVKIYENHLSDDLCKSAVDNLKKASWRTHEYYRSGTKESISYQTDLDVSYDNIPEKEEINKQIWFALERYILKDFIDYNKWWGGWNGYSGVRFNKYDETTEMQLHCDHIHSMFDGERKGVPILTVLGALNNDYEGGELMMFEDKQIHLPAGSVVVFPSNFMFPHQVRPIKKGTRFSYVSWSW